MNIYCHLLMGNGRVANYVNSERYLVNPSKDPLMRVPYNSQVKDRYSIYTGAPTNYLPTHAVVHPQYNNYSNSKV